MKGTARHEITSKTQMSFLSLPECSTRLVCVWLCPGPVSFCASPAGDVGPQWKPGCRGLLYYFSHNLYIKSMFSLSTPYCSVNIWFSVIVSLQYICLFLRYKWKYYDKVSICFYIFVILLTTVWMRKDFVCDIISGRFVLYLFIWIAQSWNTDLSNTVKLEQLYIRVIVN